MGHVGWEGAHTARYYMQLEKALRHDNTSTIMAAAVNESHSTTDLTKLYRDLNAVQNFILAFPH